MDISEVKRSLNYVVWWNGTPYVFAGCILRQNNNGVYYQAELRDMRAGYSLVIVKLEEVSLEKGV